jgi:tetratricopeptide (TPR) repeat protein
MRTFIGACLMCLGAQVALAQDYEAAGKHFNAAQEAFGKKHYKTAAGEFQAAYDITKDGILLYNIGESWEKAGDGKKAVSFYEQYLKVQPAAQDKAEVQKRVAAIKKKRFKLVDQSAPGEEPVKVAAAPPPEPPKPPEPPTPPPKAAEQLVKPNFDNPPPPPPKAAEPAKVAEPEKKAEPGVIDEKPPSKMRIAAWVLVAGTVAVLTAGAIMALAAQSRSDEISRRYRFVDSQGQPKVFDATLENEVANLRSEGELYNGLGIGFMAGAGALAVVTTALFATDYVRGKSEAKAASLRVTPMFGKNGGGISAGWSF